MFRGCSDACRRVRRGLLPDERPMIDSFAAKSTLTVGSDSYAYFRLAAVYAKHPQAALLPYSLKILLENLLRTEDDLSVRADDIDALATVDVTRPPSREIAF